MRLVVLCGLLVLVGGHSLGRPASSSSSSSSSNELAQLQELLERFEETLSEAVQAAGDSQSDYEAEDQEAGEAEEVLGRDETPEQPRARQPSALGGGAVGEGGGGGGGRLQSAVESLGRRSHLLDLLTSRRRAASCFGARMDRIGNSGGLGCNTGKG